MKHRKAEESVWNPKNYFQGEHEDWSPSEETEVNLPS